MMKKPVISVRNLGKRYLLGKGGGERYRALRDVIANSVKSVFKRNDRQNSLEELWALKDVSFDIEEGEAVGIIGRNGAGKSTLLKLLSEITEPTEGEVHLRGKVSSLLEVGIGFHPELTGRENILMNGAILGMTRSEIKGKFDEIVAFAEIEKFLDTPAKRYSSGMYIRLAFAVAAHLDPNVFLVDEVLAVGDAAFQKKCLGKMKDVATGGRTVLFVSHNMTAINTLCSRAILLSNGQNIMDGSVNEVVSEYLKVNSESEGQIIWPEPLKAPGSKAIRLHSVRVMQCDEVTGEVDIDKEISIEVEFWNYNKGSRNLCTNIYILNSMGITVLSTANTPKANSLPEEWFEKAHPTGLFRSRLTLPGNFLNDGLYYINLYIVTLGPLNIELREEQIISFNVFDTGVMREPGGGGVWAGAVRVRLPWQTEFVRSLD